jgi:hypothetical protein
MFLDFKRLTDEANKNSRLTLTSSGDLPSHPARTGFIQMIFIKFSSYLKENKLRLYYKDQQANAIQENNRTYIYIQGVPGGKANIL